MCMCIYIYICTYVYIYIYIYYSIVYCILGVKDLYKYDAGNGYPCWDVLFECSPGSRTKGGKHIKQTYYNIQADK